MRYEGIVRYVVVGVAFFSPLVLTESGFRFSQSVCDVQLLAML